MSKAFFTREAFQFLVELRYNNERAWFNANKARYEEHIKEPMLAFIEALAPGLRKLNPAYVADRRSFFRIHRDTRFSKDKTPYKTHAAAQFRHRAATADVHAPGFYFHLEPGECIVGGGIWMPEPGPLLKIRKAIAKQAPAWLAFRRSRMPLWEDEKLKRPPKGFKPEHPLIEDLKNRHFITWVDFKDGDLLKPDFLKKFLDACRKTDPLVRFLCSAMGLKG